MRFDAQTIKLLLVITPRFCRIVGDEEDPFPYNKGEGSDRTQVSPQMQEKEKDGKTTISMTPLGGALLRTFAA